MDASIAPLFRSGFQLGALTLPNRFVMSPMTRGRACASGKGRALLAGRCANREGGAAGRAPALPDAERGRRGDRFIATLRSRRPAQKMHDCTGSRM